MISIDLGKLASDEYERVLTQIQALQATGLEDIQLQVKGKESRQFLDRLSSNYEAQQALRQRVLSSLLPATVGSVGSMILLACWFWLM